MSTPLLFFRINNALRILWRFHGIKFPFVLIHRAWLLCSRKLFGPREFELAGKTHRYYFNPYSLNNELAVEVALAQAFLRGKSGRILEVGNVLSYYFLFPHDIVDKYEQAPGVINEDIVTYAPGMRYDWIVTISTLEHVGFDGQPRDPEKILKAIAKLKELLNENGQMLVTMPLNYNPHVDQMVREDRTGFSEVRYLLRVSANNQWREARFEEVVGARYRFPFPCANAIVVGLFRQT